MKSKERKIFGVEWKEAKIKLEHYWLRSRNGGEERLICELKILRNSMKIRFLLCTLTHSGAVYHANRLMEKWWYDE